MAEVLCHLPSSILHPRFVDPSSLFSGFAVLPAQSGLWNTTSPERVMFPKAVLL
jgi:hypothetical protein